MHHHNFHAHDLLKRVPAPAPELTTQDGQVFSVVYVTAQPTFTGVIGGYSTATDSSDAAPSSSTASVVLAPPLQASSTQDSSIAVASSSASQTSSPSNLVTASVTSIAALSTTLVSSTTSYRPSTHTAIAGAAATSAAATSDASSSSGMSTAAKAGLAIGIICAIGAVAALILIMLSKKRRQQEQQARADMEKDQTSRNYQATQAMSSTPNAPRLSLRPVSRLVPELMGGSRPKSRLSQGNMLATFHEASTQDAPTHLSPPGAVAHRNLTEKSSQQENPFRDPENPFADPEKAAMSAPSQTAPPPAFNAQASQPPSAMSPQGPTQVPFPAPTSTRNSPKVPAPLVVPAAATAIAPGAPSPVIAPGPGPDLPAGNVYRILMDFKPTMEDELELRTGAHVRLLHEYDDGWALCIRLDRSQQGVVPRTCLAARPSKPRPGPGPGPGPRGPPAPGRMSPVVSRPVTPSNQSPRSNGPHGPHGPGQASPRSARPFPTASSNHPAGPQSRPSSPGAFNQPPRPLSPGPRPQKRSMSPGPYEGASGPKPMADPTQRRRSNSASAASVKARQNSPPGPSKLGPGTSPIRSASPGVAM